MIVNACQSFETNVFSVSPIFRNDAHECAYVHANYHTTKIHSKLEELVKKMYGWWQVVGGSGTVMSAVSGVSSSSGGSSGQSTPIALVPNVIDSLSRLSSSQVNKYWKVTRENN